MIYEVFTISIPNLCLAKWSKLLICCIYSEWKLEVMMSQWQAFFKSKIKVNDDGQKE